MEFEFGIREQDSQFQKYMQQQKHHSMMQLMGAIRSIFGGFGGMWGGGGMGGMDDDIGRDWVGNGRDGWRMGMMGGQEWAGWGEG